jgi:hypothetical protein
MQNLVEKLRDGATWNNKAFEGRIILKWIFEKCVRVWTGFLLLRLGTGGGLL